MKNKRVLSMVLALMMIAGIFAGCSNKDAAGSADNNQTQAVNEEEASAQTSEPVTSEKEEIVSFIAKDKDSNVLTLVPVFDKDEKTAIAAYVMSVTDKNKKVLSGKEYKLLNCVISASGSGGKITLDTDKNKSFIQVEAYSDLSGNLVAIRDIKDVNKNKKNDEYLKLTSKTDSQKVKHYIVVQSNNAYSFVSISKDASGKFFMTDGKNRSEVKKVDAQNTAAAKKVKEDTSKNRLVTTTKPKNKITTTKASANPADDTTVPLDSYINIVLKRNSKAECSSPNVTLATGEIYIEKGGDYRITSQTDNWHGQIIVKLKNTEKCELRFENVNITNTSKNIIQIIDSSINSDRSFLEAEAAADSAADDSIKEISDNNMAPNVDLSFPTGTSSSFSTSANSYTGVIYNESKLTIKGNGKALIKSMKNANNCICSTKSVSIKNVALNLETASNNVPSTIASGSGSAKGIFSYSKVNVESGNLIIKSNGDSIRCDSFYSYGGTTNIQSSACDGIDADDAIVISGGSVTSVALQKSSFKVRRVNNTEKGIGKGIRKGRGDTFKITGGTVIGESLKISTVQQDSTQPSVTCRVVKQGAKTDAAANESKVPAVLSISGLKSSMNKCTKFLYSSSKVKKGNLYTVKTDKNSVKMKKTDWKGNVGIAKVVSSKPNQ